MTASTEKMVPVSLTIGNQTWLLGSVPDAGPIDDREMGPLLEGLATAVRRQVTNMADRMYSTRDAAAILRRHRAALTFAVRTAPGHNVTGPMVRVLREAGGMSRTDLARAMGHDPRSVKTWEAGRPSRFTLVEDWRASVALGYSPTAILAAYFALTTETEPVPVVPA